MKKILSLLILSLTLFSCVKEEAKAPELQQNINTELQSAESFLGADYLVQNFYSLKSNEDVFEVDKFSYDLKISVDQSSKYVWLNNARFSDVVSISKADVTFPLSPNDYEFVYDTPELSNEGNAIGKWWNTDNYYLVHAGYDEKGKKDKNYFLVDFEELSNGIQVIAFDLEGNEIKNVQYSFNETYNHEGFSIESGKLIIEPEKSEWDFIFTQYRHVFEDGTPYLVTGVLNNPYNTIAYTDENISWENLQYNDIPTSSFSFDADVVGYNWKSYTFESNSYVINSNKTYVIHNTIDNVFYKLRFIDFYNDEGVKGNFKFEYQLITQ